MKRLSAVIRAFVLFCFLGLQMVLPIKAYAFAFVPAIMAAGSMAPITEAVVGAIVGGVAFLGFGAIAGDSRSGQVATTAGGIAIPQGWTAGTNAAPAPPSTSSGITAYKSNWAGDTTRYTSASAAANGTGIKICTSISRTWVSSTNTSGTTWRVTCSGSYATDIAVNTDGIICPSGYTGTTSCTLSDATAVVKPATAANGNPLPCQIIHGSTGYAYDSKNGRCPAVDTPIPASDGSGRTMVAHGDGTFSVVPALPATTPQAKAAEPTLTGEALPNGGTRLTQVIPYIGADGLPYTAKLITELDADGKVVGQSGTTTAGTGSLGGGAVVPPIDINCQKTNTCDVATDTTLKEIRDAVKVPTATQPNTDHDPLYTKGVKTLTSVWNNFKATLNSSAIVSFVNGFFNVNVSGSCPTWSTSIGMGLPNFVIDQLCTPMADNMFAVVRGVLMVVAAWVAFRIAIDY